MVAMESRMPRVGLFALASFLALDGGLAAGQRYVVPIASRQFEPAAVDVLLYVVTFVDVALGLGVVVALLALCLAPRSTRVVVLAQSAAMLAALTLLLRVGSRLLLSGGAFSSPAVVATLTRLGGTVVSLGNAAVSALLLVVILRVTRAGRAPVAAAVALIALVLVGARVVAQGLSLAGVIADPGAMEALDLGQRWGQIGCDVLIIGLCVRASTVVGRVPADAQ
jgi:hypothetical protein